MGEHGQGDVPVPGNPFADLIVVEAASIFGGLETLLDRPPGTGDGDDLLASDGSGMKAQVVGDIGGVVDAAANQQGAGESDRDVAEGR
nr:hypothetical protein [Nocardia mangyaensis]